MFLKMLCFFCASFNCFRQCIDTQAHSHNSKCPKS
nr:MAG TPA: hypothetical protein [Caudoviricetes sp.]